MKSTSYIPLALPGWSAARWTRVAAGLVVTCAALIAGNVLAMPGCMDPVACNYDAAATVGDGSCCYGACVGVSLSDAAGDGWNGAELVIRDLAGEVMAQIQMPSGFSSDTTLCLAEGCYTVECSSGEFPEDIAWELTGIPAGPLQGTPQGPVHFSTSVGACVFGCDVPTACNFDPEVIVSDDSTCVFSGCSGCTYPAALNYDEAATLEDGSCLFAGCTDALAANYSPHAMQSDGSCFYCPGTGPDACLGDVNGDQAVNIFDLLAVLISFGDACD